MKTFVLFLFLMIFSFGFSQQQKIVKESKNHIETIYYFPAFFYPEENSVPQIVIFVTYYEWENKYGDFVMGESIPVKRKYANWIYKSYKKTEHFQTAKKICGKRPTIHIET